MTYREALAWLDSLQGSGIRPGLQRVKALLRAAGKPQQAFPSVIVAGTNGKGSTAATLASILSSSGYRVGLYTSPHLVDILERWSVDGRNIPATMLAAATDELRATSQRSGVVPTYFEALTVVAFMLFRTMGCEIAVLEVGMGGRLDATNVVRPLAAVITSISIDHTEFLGRTIRAIAGEKAGVIHRGAAVVTSNDDAVVLDVLNRRAHRFGIDLHVLREETAVSALRMSANGSRFALRTPMRSYRLQTSLTGAHQIANVSLAVRVSELIASALPRITADAIADGVRSARWRGRLECFVIGDKTVYVDGAHNAQGVASVAAFVARKVPRPRTLVFGALQDKDFTNMAAELFPMFETIILTEPESDRALPLTALRSLATREGVAVHQFRRPSGAFRRALAGPASRIVVCGSLYLAGSAIAFFDRVVASAKSSNVAETISRNAIRRR
ncbi:MAG: folylpolyglutamate synthase/dihydrofolate synthase family protein [Acidobacteriota bacterium]